MLSCQRSCSCLRTSPHSRIVISPIFARSFRRLFSIIAMKAGSFVSGAKRPLAQGSAFCCALGFSCCSGAPIEGPVWMRFLRS